MSNKTKCSACGAEFDVNLPACPECGSGDRNIRLKDFVKLKYKRELREIPPVDTPEE